MVPLITTSRECEPVSDWSSIPWPQLGKWSAVARLRWVKRRSRDAEQGVDICGNVFLPHGSIVPRTDAWSAMGRKKGDSSDWFVWNRFATGEMNIRVVLYTVGDAGWGLICEGAHHTYMDRPHKREEWTNGPRKNKKEETRNFGHSPYTTQLGVQEGLPSHLTNCIYRFWNGLSGELFKV